MGKSPGRSREKDSAMLPTLFHGPGLKASMVPPAYRSGSEVLRSTLSTLVLRIWVPQPIGSQGQEWQAYRVKRTVLSG